VRHQNATRLGGDLKYLRIRSPVWDDAAGAAKIDRRFTPPQPSTDFRVQVSIGLKTEAQASYTDLSLFARSKRSIMSGVRG